MSKNISLKKKLIQINESTKFMNGALNHFLRIFMDFDVLFI